MACMTHDVMLLSARVCVLAAIKYTARPFKRATDGSLRRISLLNHFGVDVLCFIHLPDCSVGVHFCEAAKCTVSW